MMALVLPRWPTPTRESVQEFFELPVACDPFGEIGRKLRVQDPKQVVFYLCGHASLETAYTDMNNTQAPLGRARHPGGRVLITVTGQMR
jgi:hypothetical protein